jgi:hypothetical protein
LGANASNLTGSVMRLFVVFLLMIGLAACDLPFVPLI